MEWYFGSDGDDLVVPKNQESLEMISSHDSWSQWGVNAFGGSEYPKKNFCGGTNLTREELTFNGKGFDINNFGYQREHSNNSSMCQELYDGSPLWNTEQADYHHQFTEDQATINQMDDIFFSSLLEEDLNSAENLNGSSKHSPESFTHGMGSSRYLQTHAFSPSVGWENGEVSSSTFPVVKQQSLNGYVGEETSLEESVLQELERVTAQFTAKTRICFRDALYRLAENSKQTVNSNEDGEIIMETMLASDDETLRAGETEVTESKTNAIDRAIANLMFSNIAFDDEDNETTEGVHCNLSQMQQNSCCPQSHHTNLAGDAEVPNVGIVSKAELV